MKAIEHYQRLEFDGTPIYVRPDMPDWVVPASQLDDAIQQIAEPLSAADELLFSRMLSRIDDKPPQTYQGRQAFKTAGKLKECWFHITNACNMRCRHCLFASGEENLLSIDNETLCSAVDQACDLGCTIFYFTGGEPLIYPQFQSVCERILKDPSAHVVILTNAKAISSHTGWLEKQDRQRLHFQISIDGMEENHDDLRGAGSFIQLQSDLLILRELGFPVTLSMSINRRNAHEMSELVDFARKHCVGNLHFMWLFLKGKADQELFIEPGEIFQHARTAYEKAEKLGISIDNFDIMKTQVFNFPGIKMDLNNACWESLAIGPNGIVYPSPALVFDDKFNCGHLSEGLRNVWQTSPLMQTIRSLTVAQCEHLSANPLRYITGGGDIDHSYIYSGKFAGHDPYMPLYETMALYLISREAKESPDTGRLTMRVRMGERVEECEGGGETVCFTHSNCVLSLSARDGHASIRSFYSQAAEDVNEDIVNPVHYDREMISHIPEEACVRSYGCGSPVMDCRLQPGEYLVDLGSGTGVECFIAAKQVGPAGKIFGIDMSDTMLARARSAQFEVAQNLGYSNVEFRKGILEEIPLDDTSIDAVISNCVINLSINKRQTFREIFRILKSGGRILISDIINSSDIPLEIKLNEKLRGECIGGAMHERDLFGMLEDFGFVGIRVVKRFFYREVKGYPFYSLTYQAYKPGETVQQDLIYRGPFAGVVSDDGTVIQRGRKVTIEMPPGAALSEDFMLLDDSGQVTNLSQEVSCCCLPASPATGEECCCPPQMESSCCSPVSTATDGECNCPPIESNHKSGCLICGKPLIVLQSPKILSCHYCKKTVRVEHCCEDGHFVCDQCHIHVAADIIKAVCLKTTEKDVLAILHELRSDPHFPVHGPHHHPMVPGILLAAYRNNGGNITDEQILTGISRGAQIPGAFCSFFGIDGAAVGVGVAFSVILGASPFEGTKRNMVQKVVIRAAEKIAGHPAARCCQREVWIALKEAEAISKELLPVSIIAQYPLQCEQFMTTDYCSGNACPLKQSMN